MKRSASAQWKGNLEDGQGTLTTESGVLTSMPYSFKTRFKDDNGTNPEELIGAAHAGCFSMALSMILREHDFTAERIDTEATVQLDEVGGGFAITKVHLHCRASVPGANEDQFAEAAEAAKANCPVSKLFTAEITMDAALEG